MRLNTRKTKGHTYLYFLESYRNSASGKPLTRTVKSFGRLDKLLEDDPDIMQKLQAEVDELNSKAQEQRMREIDEYLKEFRKSSDYSSSSLPLSVKNYGICVYKALWDELDIDSKLQKLQNETRCKFDFPNATFLMSALRCIKPNSKIATFEDRCNYILPFDTLKEQDLYKSLDLLAEFKQEIEKHIFKKIEQNYKRVVSVALYDVTTFFFESVSADALKAFGFSKDNKVNEVQVVLSLLIDEEGIPIGYELFPGNTSEFSTMESMLQKLKRDYKIKQVVIVADRGLNSKANLARIKKMGFDYVMANKLKGASEDIKRHLFSDTGYEVSQDGSGHEFKYKVISRSENVKLDGEEIDLESSLAIMYSSKRAEKDRRDRELLVLKAQRLVANPAQFRTELKKGGKSFVIMDTGTSELRLDEKKISEQSRFDGYYGVVSSRKDLTASDILEMYHKLWKIEESFRVMKTNLEARPCYVWTENRIRGHFVVCYMALVLQRLLEYKLRSVGFELSTHRIQEAISGANVGILEYDNSPVYMKLDKEPEHDVIRGLLSMNKISQCNTKEQLKKILRSKIAG